MLAPVTNPAAANAGKDHQKKKKRILLREETLVNKKRISISKMREWRLLLLTLFNSGVKL